MTTTNLSRHTTCGDAGGRTTSGEPCSVAFGLAENGFCIHHDPERAAEARLVRAAGARASADIARLARAIKSTVAPANLPQHDPETLEQLAKWLQWTTRAVATGEIDHRVAREITTSLRELRPTIIAIGLERRVRELEASLKRANAELARREGRAS